MRTRPKLFKPILEAFDWYLRLDWIAREALAGIAGGAMTGLAAYLTGRVTFLGTIIAVVIGAGIAMWLVAQARRLRGITDRTQRAPLEPLGGSVGAKIRAKEIDKFELDVEGNFATGVDLEAGKMSETQIAVKDRREGTDEKTVQMEAKKGAEPARVLKAIEAKPAPADESERARRERDELRSKS